MLSALAAAALVVIMGAILGEILVSRRVASPPLHPELRPLAAGLTAADAVDEVRGADFFVARIDRISAKLTTLKEYRDVVGLVGTGPGVTGFIGDPAERAVWVLALTGEVYPNGRTAMSWGQPVRSAAPPQSVRWAIFLLDAVRGGPLVAAAGSEAEWPRTFEQLTDHPLSLISPPPAPRGGPLPVRVPAAQVVSQLLGAIGGQADRLDHKLMRWSEFAAVVGDPSVTSRAQRPVWVLAVSGDVAPSRASTGAPPGSFPWGVFVVDAGDDELISVQVGTRERWPTFFDSLPDHAPMAGG